MCPEAVVLLPPSEGKAPGGRAGSRYGDARRDPASNRFGGLEPAREEVVGALHKAIEGGGDLEDLLEVKGANLAAAVERNWLLYDAPVMPAIERYTGVLYSHLGYPEMPSKAQEGFRERAIIFSGLLGLVAPGDLVPDYKLKMDATLPGTGPLQAWWRARLTPVLNDQLAGKLVWNLLTEVHAEAWAGCRDVAAEVSVRFVERRNGRERTLSHWNKALKGAFVRHLATRGWSLQSAEKFENDGYRYAPELSTVQAGRGEMVFAKNA